MEGFAPRLITGEVTGPEPIRHFPGDVSAA